MKLYISRHGQTPWNVEDLICGRTDVPLTEVGQQQAQRLAESAQDKEIDVILCSPMLRARQTAQAVSDAIGVPIQIDERLIEMDFGTFEGTSRFGEEFQWIRAQMSTRFPGGESGFDVAYRVYSLLYEIKEKYADKTVLLVCHNCVSRAVRSFFMNLSTEEYGNYHAPNAQLVEYEM
jgi:probable phosphoglycerate mutase